MIGCEVLGSAGGGRWSFRQKDCLMEPVESCALIFVMIDGKMIVGLSPTQRVNLLWPNLWCAQPHSKAPCKITSTLIEVIFDENPPMFKLEVESWSNNSEFKLTELLPLKLVYRPHSFISLLQANDWQPSVAVMYVGSLLFDVVMSQSGQLMPTQWAVNGMIMEVTVMRLLR